MFVAAVFGITWVIFGNRKKAHNATRHISKWTIILVLAAYWTDQIERFLTGHILSIGFGDFIIFMFVSVVIVLAFEQIR